MNRKSINKTQKLLTIITILAVFQFIVNNALFIHTHKMANGQIIAHSHPFSKKSQDKNDNQQQHHHSKSAYTALDNLAHAATFISAVLFNCQFQVQHTFNHAWHQNYHKIVKSNIDERAPPTLI